MKRQTISLLLILAFVLCAVGVSHARNYDPKSGRFISRDPAGEGEGPNPYLYCDDSPAVRVDPLGLWNSDVHQGMTTRWALSMTIRGDAADLIGYADDDVDKVHDPAQMNDANWSWHFDRSTGGTDSRWVHFGEEMAVAKQSCNWKMRNDSSMLAAAHLGVALHPVQDWVAHGDYNRRGEAPRLGLGIIESRHYWHNWDSPARDGKSMPDNPALDAGGLLGRPTMDVFHLGTTLSNGDRTYWTEFTPGTSRILFTEFLTRGALADFQAFVMQNSKPCGACQQAFLGRQ